jgi:hypothetical protein
MDRTYFEYAKEGDNIRFTEERVRDIIRDGHGYLTVEQERT